MATSRQLARDARRDCKPYAEFTDWLLSRIQQQRDQILCYGKIYPLDSNLKNDYGVDLYKSILNQLVKDGVINPTTSSKGRQAVEINIATSISAWTSGTLADWPEQAHKSHVWNDEIKKAFEDITSYIGVRLREEYDQIQNRTRTQLRIPSNRPPADPSPYKDGSGTKRGREHESSWRMDEVRDAAEKISSGRQQISSLDDNRMHKKARQDDHMISSHSLRSSPGFQQRPTSDHRRDIVYEETVQNTKKDAYLAYFPEEDWDKASKLLDCVRSKHPSALISLIYERNRLEAICEDCPEKQFAIYVHSQAFAFVESHLNSQSHHDMVTTRSRHEHKRTVILPTLSASTTPNENKKHLSHEMPLTSSLVRDQASSSAVRELDTPQTATSSEPLVTVHQYNRLDADQAKLSHEHKSLVIDVTSLQQTAQEIQTTLSTVYKKQRESDTTLKNINEKFIPHVQKNQVEVKDTLQRFRERILDTSQKLKKLTEICERRHQKFEKLEEDGKEQHQLLTVQTNLLVTVHGDVEVSKERLITIDGTISSLNEQITTLENRIDQVSKAVTSTAETKEIKDNLDDFTKTTETKFTDLEAKFVEAYKKTVEKTAMQRKFSKQKNENEKVVKEIKQLATASSERLQAMEDAFNEEKLDSREAVRVEVESLQKELAVRDEEIQDVKKSLELERDAAKAQRLAYEQQIETANKDHIKAIKTFQAKNDTSLKTMMDRVNSLEEANSTLMNILDRVKRLESVAVLDDTIVVDHPGPAAISTMKTPAKKTVVELRGRGSGA